LPYPVHDADDLPTAPDAVLLPAEPESLAERVFAGENGCEPSAVDDDDLGCFRVVAVENVRADEAMPIASKYPGDAMRSLHRRLPRWRHRTAIDGEPAWKLYALRGARGRPVADTRQRPDTIVEPRPERAEFVRSP
jgi:hypothetical protein